MPILKGMFKKTNYISISGDIPKAQPETEMELAAAPEVPEGLWTKCKKCKTGLYTKDLEEHDYVCQKCGSHMRLSARQRLRMLIDEGTFEVWDRGLLTSDPLNFPDYPEKLKKLQEATGLEEAVICGKGFIDGVETVICVMDAAFMMASMGSVVGEKITRAVERATALCLPLIIYCCSGGARMQEGIISLMQMAKTSAALKKHSNAGLLYVSVLTDPTTGGVTASFAMLGDIIIAEPGALVGFAGPRVIEQTIGQKLPKGFQRSEFLLEHGLIDAIVERSRQKQVLKQMIMMHQPYEKKEEETR